MPVWNVLIVEDDPETREFFSASVRGNAGLALVASLGTVADALAWIAAATAGPDVLLTDLGLPDGSGLQVMAAMTARFAQCEPLVISMFGDEEHVLASIEAGALGYIHKDSSPADIAQAILEMKAGASPISPMIARRVLLKYRALHAASPAPGGAPDLPPPADPKAKTLLSVREQEVLDLIARGFSYQEIARLQGLSVHTVQSHIKNLYVKLAVHSKNEAVFEATRMGLLRFGA